MSPMYTPPPGTLTGQTRIAPARTASMSMWPSVLCSCRSAALIAKRCGAPTRNAPKSPALWESGIVAEGEVPSWPMNGRIRVASATMSCGAKVRIGFWTEPSGRAA